MGKMDNMGFGKNKPKINIDNIDDMRPDPKDVHVFNKDKHDNWEDKRLIDIDKQLTDEYKKLPEVVKKYILDIEKLSLEVDDLKKELLVAGKNNDQQKINELNTDLTKIAHKMNYIDAKLREDEEMNEIFENYNNLIDDKYFLVNSTSKNN